MIIRWTWQIRPNPSTTSSPTPLENICALFDAMELGYKDAESTRGRPQPSFIPSRRFRDDVLFFPAVEVMILLINMLRTT